MIKTKFWNDMNHYYMILEGIKEHSYPMQMVLNNNIAGILQAELRREDDLVFCYYEISGKESLQEFLEHGVMNESILQKFFVYMIEAVQAGQSYLLEENDFILEPSFIFLDKDVGKVSLCYHSGYQVPFHEQIKGLIEYLLNKVNYKEEGAVLLIYSLYQRINEAGCTFHDMLDLIQGIRQTPYFAREKLDDTIKYKEEQKEEAVKEESEKRNMNDLPAYRPLREKVEGEMEIMHYPVKSFIAAGIVLLFCLFGFLLLYRLSFFGNLDEAEHGNIKMLGTAVLFLLFFVLICCRLFRKECKISKVVQTTKFIDGDHLGSTTVLCDFSDKDKERGMLRSTKIYKLQPIEGNQYDTILMTEFPFFIGKLKSKVGHTISNETVSRFHAKIDKDANGFFLMDLNSTNGTFCNGERLEINEKKILSLGDIISFSNVRYQFIENKVLQH